MRMKSTATVLGFWILASSLVLLGQYLIEVWLANLFGYNNNEKLMSSHLYLIISSRAIAAFSLFRLLYNYDN